MTRALRITLTFSAAVALSVVAIVGWPVLIAMRD